MTEASESSVAETQSTRTVLSSGLAEFLIEFSITLNKHTMYPTGHPALTPAVQRLHTRLHHLLESRPALSLGVAAKQLIIEGVATNPKNGVLCDLAARLHDHNFGALEFDRGIESHELVSLFRLLMTDPEADDGPFIQDLTKKFTPSRHVTVFPIRYENLELIGADDSETAEEAAARTRAAQLWVGLAHAAMDLDAVENAEPDIAPEAVADAISSHTGGTAYDDVVVGYMLKIAEELRTGETHDQAVLRKRMAALIEGLDERALQRLLTMGGDRAQRRQFLQSASEGMEVDAVIDLVTTANKFEGENVSRSLLRMLKKLAQHSTQGGRERRMLAESSVREQVNQLIEGWSLDDPAPSEYAEALEKMTAATSFVAVAPKAFHVAEADRLFQMALEIDEIGPAVLASVDHLFLSEHAAWMLRGLGAADAPNVVGALREHLSGPEKVTEFLQVERVDTETLALLTSLIGEAAVEPMVNVLKETENQHKRRTIIDHLIALGPMVGPPAVAALADQRWQVKRNMLHILAGLEQRPDFDASAYVSHPRAQVRLEALRIMFDTAEQRNTALRNALTDEDDRIVRLGLQAAIQSCPQTAAPLIGNKLGPTCPEELRLLAVRALGTCGGHLAVRMLLNLAAPRRRLFLGWRTPRKTRAYIAALTALQGHRDDLKVTHALDVAARSRDPEIARAGRGGGNP